MDIFQHRYYKLNKTMMTLIGQWPYCKSRTRHVFPVLLILFGPCHVLSWTLAAVKYHDDWKVLMDCTLPFLTNAIVATKLIGFTKNSQNTLQLLNRIRTDWQKWAQDREIGILHAYTEKGKKITTVYIAFMFLGLLIGILLPVMPKVIDVLLRNGTEQGKFLFPIVYYRIDEQKYYFYIIVYSYVCIFMATAIIITHEVMLISYVHHVSGIFSALGHKLEQIGYDETLVGNKNPCARVDRELLHVASCIDRHNDAIEYANLIDAAYSSSFFVTIGLGMILTNVTGLEIVRRRNDSTEVTRFIVFAISVALYFYVECYIGQILTDCSISIHFSMYNNQWYKVSVKTRKLLQFMSMRSRVPCELRAGKMLVISMKTYALALKTSISYFAFTRSLQLT